MFPSRKMEKEKKKKKERERETLRDYGKERLKGNK
jgi:hypothetical protein